MNDNDETSLAYQGLDEGNQQMRLKNDSYLFSGMALWLALLYSSLFQLSGAIIGSIVLSIAASANLVPVNPDGSYDSSSPQAVVILLLVNLLSMVLLGVLAFFFNRKTRIIPQKQKVSISKNDGKVVLIAFAFMLFVIGSVNYLAELIRARFFPEIDIETPYDLLMGDKLTTIILAMIVVAVIAPIVEEIFYRWTMVGTLTKGQGKRATICLSALIFSLAHSASDLTASFYFFVIHLIATFIIGIIIGWVFIQTEKVILAIMLHASWNFFLVIGMLFEWLGIYGIYVFVYLGLIGLGLLGSVMAIIHYFRKQENPLQQLKRIIFEDSSAKNETTEPNKGEKQEPTRRPFLEKISIPREWLGLIGGYLLFAVLIPVTLSFLETFLNSGGMIQLIYYVVLVAISSYFVYTNYKTFKKYYQQEQTEVY
ncbi:MAG: CPBP family intramembrane metalloprotease [Candidatus Heimdallarchaeota archaeon]|nr:CPBP family intramembrane metalloprotease [Candidatus Heimdallarchaeota archaeon]